MNNITTLENVFQRVDTMFQTCHDSFIPVKDISFDDLDTIKIAGSTHPLKPIAQRSIAWRLGIPYNYLRKCPAEIQSVQMNYWIEHEKNEQLFARFDGNSVRAIFTPKYKPVDNMDVILEIYGMGYQPETQVQCHLDDEFMSLSIMDGKRSLRSMETGSGPVCLFQFGGRIGQSVRIGIYPASDLYKRISFENGALGIIPACVHKDPE